MIDVDNQLVSSGIVSAGSGIVVVVVDASWMHFQHSFCWISIGSVGTHTRKSGKTK